MRNSALLTCSGIVRVVHSRPLRLGEVISSIVCSNEVITRLCMMVDVQLGYMATHRDCAAAGGADLAQSSSRRSRGQQQQQLHESLLFEALYLFFALLNMKQCTLCSCHFSFPLRRWQACVTTDRALLLNRL